MNELEKKLKIKLEEKDGKLHYGGSLYLQGTQITSLPDNLTVGGSLYLRGTQITSLPDNLTVGGSLDLQGTQITSLPDNLNKNAPTCYFWKNRKYIKADDIFSIVVSEKRNVFRIRQIGCSKIKYLVTDGNGKWSHGDTLKDAKNDLIYKISNRDTSKYKNLTVDSVVSFEFAVEMYRVITGSCGYGVKNFVENNLKHKKAKYKISEIIEITKDQYQAGVFKSFFEKSENQ